MGNCCKPTSNQSDKKFGLCMTYYCCFHDDWDDTSSEDTPIEENRKQHIKPLKSRKIEKEYEETDYTAWKLSAAAGVAKSKARKEARAKRLENKKPKKEKSKTINKGREHTYYFYPH